MVYKIGTKYIALMLCKLYYQLVMSNLIQLYFNLIDSFLERESFNLWRSLLMITFYQQMKTPISFYT